MKCEAGEESRMGHSRRLKIQRGTSWTWMMVGMIHTQHLEENREVNVKSRILAKNKHSHREKPVLQIPHTVAQLQI